MNTYEVNGAELGSGTRSAGVLWLGALSLYADGVGKATVSGWVYVYGGITAAAESVGQFGQAIQVYANGVPEAVIKGIATPVINLFGAALPAAQGVGKFGAGLVQAVYGSASAFAVGKWTTSAVIKWIGASLPEAVTTVVISLSQLVFGRIDPTITTTSGFTNFGEYAPDERYIIVPQEDRKVSVA